MKNIQNTVLRAIACIGIISVVLLSAGCQAQTDNVPTPTETARNTAAPTSTPTETADTTPPVDVKPAVETEDSFMTYTAGDEIVLSASDDYSGVADIKITVRYSREPVEVDKRGELPIVSEFGKEHFEQVGDTYELRFTYDTPGMYYMAYSLTDGVGNTNDNDRYSTGFHIIPAQLPETSLDFNWALTEGYAVVKLGNRRETYVNAKGERAFDRDFKFAYNFVDGLARVQEDNDGSRYSYINAAGEQAFDRDFAGALDFQGGFAAVKLDNDRWTYINTSGEQAFDIDFKSAYSFVNGTAVVWLDDGNMAYINTNGEIVEK